MSLSALPRVAPETIGLPLPRTGPLPEKLNHTIRALSDLLLIKQYGLLPEELNHTIQAPLGGVKSTEPGSARNYCQITQNTGLSRIHLYTLV